nr:hypothetical protein CoNPh37_CDS0196 [Staphylococcus phage S-CoN_Ph37]
MYDVSDIKINLIIEIMFFYHLSNQKSFKFLVLYIE